MWFLIGILDKLSLHIPLGFQYDTCQKQVRSLVAEEWGLSYRGLNEWGLSYRGLNKYPYTTIEKGIWNHNAGNYLGRYVKPWVKAFIIVGITLGAPPLGRTKIPAPLDDETLSTKTYIQDLA